MKAKVESFTHPSELYKFGWRSGTSFSSHSTSKSSSSLFEIFINWSWLPHLICSCQKNSLALAWKGLSSIQRTQIANNLQLYSYFRGGDVQHKHPLAKQEKSLSPPHLIQFLHFISRPHVINVSLSRHRLAMCAFKAQSERIYAFDPISLPLYHVAAGLLGSLSVGSNLRPQIEAWPAKLCFSAWLIWQHLLRRSN